MVYTLHVVYISIQLVCETSVVIWIPNTQLMRPILRGRTSYHKISWTFEAARCTLWLFQSLWNLTVATAAALLRGLANPISSFQDCTRFAGGKSYRGRIAALLICSITLLLPADLRWHAYTKKIHSVTLENVLVSYWILIGKCIHE